MFNIVNVNSNTERETRTERIRTMKTKIIKKYKVTALDSPFDIHMQNNAQILSLIYIGKDKDLYISTLIDPAIPLPKVTRRFIVLSDDSSLTNPDFYFYLSTVTPSITYHLFEELTFPIHYHSPGDINDIPKQSKPQLSIYNKSQSSETINKK